MSYSLFAKNKIDMRPLFQTKILAPTIIEYCNNYLWVYSIADHKIYKLIPKSGKIITQNNLLELPEKSKITAMGCFQDTIIFASLERPLNSKETTMLYRLNQGLTLQKVSILPGSQHIRDILCHKDKCIFLANNVYITTDFKTYNEFPIPKAEKIERIFRNKDANPFSDWQDKHILAEAQYFKALISPQGNLFLLDPQRGSIITYNDYATHETIDSKNFKKWGDWGTWEGQLMFPKSIGFLEKYNAIVISDVGLKLLLLFTPEGEYLGKVGMNTKEDKFLYPIDIVTAENKIYVADFKNNLLLGIEILSLGDKYKKTSDNIDDLLRKDLFKNNTIVQSFNETRCLHCHDGLATLRLDKFVNLNKFHHPINRSLKGNVIISDAKKLDLPLWNELVSCASCHKPHHDAITQESDEPKVPFYLRKNYLDLCTTCHADKKSPENNHIGLERIINDKITDRVTSCSDCHVMHNSSNNLTSLGDPQLCFSCHNETTTPMVHPFGAQKLKDEPKNLTCFSCHGIHGTLKENKYARHSKTGVTATCTSCHTELEEQIGKNKHLASKKNLNITHSWPGRESVCVDCHSPHKKFDSILAKCTQCHTDRIHDHKKQIPIMATKRGEGISLEQEKITCTTCHEHHGLTKNKSYLKDRETLLRFCSSCHDEDTSNLFDDYHKKFNKTNIKKNPERGKK